MNLAISCSCSGVRFHFVDEQWNIKIVTVGLEKFSGKHTGANISSAMQRLLIDIKVPLEKLGYNVTDNASNMIKAFVKFDESIADMLLDKCKLPTPTEPNSAAAPVASTSSSEPRQNNPYDSEDSDTELVVVLEDSEEGIYSFEILFCLIGASLHRVY